MKKILFLAVISLTLFSCDLGNDIPLDGMVRVSLNLAIEAPVVIGEEPISEMSPLTKVLTADEKTVQNIWVLQFEKAATTAASKLLYKIHIPFADITLGAGGLYAIDVNLKASDTDQELRMVANIGETFFNSGDNNAVVNDYSLQDFETAVIPTSSVTVTDLKTNLAMVGAKTTPIKLSSSTASPPTPIVIEAPLYRLYSQIQLRYNIEESLRTRLKMTEVRLVHSPIKIPLKQALIQLEHEVQQNAAGTSAKYVYTEKIQVLVNVAQTPTIITSVASDHNTAPAESYVFFLPQNLGGIFGPYKARKSGFNAVGATVKDVSHLELVATYTPDITSPTVTLTIVFRIFLGGNESTDYNVLCNHIYTISTNISDVDHLNDLNVYIDGDSKKQRYAPAP